MAISNLVKTKPLGGLGDPNQGFGIGGLFKTPIANAAAPKPALSVAPKVNFQPATGTAPLAKTGPTAPATSGLVGLTPKAEHGFDLNKAIAAPAAQPAPVQQAPAHGVITPTPAYQPPQQQQQTPPAAPPANTFGATTQALATFDPTKTPGYIASQSAYQQKVNELEALRKDYADKTMQIQGTPGSNLTLASGQQGLLNQRFLSSSEAAQGAVNQQQTAISNALTATGQQQGALQSAAGLVQPQLAGYNQQGFNPLTGAFSGGGDLNSVVSQVAQKVSAGQMTYNDALTALSGYGQGGINALQQALPAGFNVAQSNTLGALQGQVGPAYQFADEALKNVETLMSQLPGLQNTNIPGVNAVTKGFSTVTGIGSEATRAVTGAVQTLRNAYASLLASAKGGTPTDYSGQAQAEIPANPTPNDIAAIRANFQKLGGVRKDIYGNPGSANTGSNEPISAGGFTFVYDNQGNIVPAQ